MVTFRNNNNKRSNFRRNDRNFKTNNNVDRVKFSSNFSNNENFQRIHYRSKSRYISCDF